MSTLKRLEFLILKCLYKIYSSTIKEYTLHKMGSINNKVLNCIYRAYSSIYKNKSSIEKDLISSIENLRRKLLKDNNDINQVIYNLDSSIKKEKKEVSIIKEICAASIPYRKARFLFKIIREFKPKICLELGTGLGISSSYIGAALKINKYGKLLTIEGSPARAHFSKIVLKKLLLNNVLVEVGWFKEVLDRILDDLKKIDFIFLDGNHEMNSTLYYFNKFLPYLSKDSIIVLDDIRWSKGMKKAWKIIKNDLRITYSIDMYEFGIIINTKKNLKRKNFNLMLNYIH